MSAAGTNWQKATGDPSGPLGDWPAYDRKDRAALYVTLADAELTHDRDRAANRCAPGKAEKAAARR